MSGADGAVPSYLPGDRIRYRIDNIGLIGTDALVNTGDTGTVLGPAPGTLPEGWLFTEPDAHPTKLCPVPPSMIERAD